MKKIMFAAVAATALTGFCVESQVVGYSNKTLDPGFTVMSGVFLGVGLGQKIDVQDIKLSGNVDSVDNMQLLDSDSVSSATYQWGSEETTPVWIEDPVGSENWVPVPGWIAPNGEDLLEWEMDAAQGFMIYVKNSGVSISFAGEVKDSNQEFTSAGGFSVLGNFNPTAMSVQNIALSGETVDSTDNMQLLDADSVSEVTYQWGSEDTTPVWIEDPVGSENWVPVPGWIAPNGEELLDWDMPAGQGFLLYTKNAGVKVTINSYNNAK